jgi:hypothetical protein
VRYLVVTDDEHAASEALESVRESLDGAHIQVIRGLV